MLYAVFVGASFRYLDRLTRVYCTVEVVDVIALVGSDDKLDVQVYFTVNDGQNILSHSGCLVRSLYINHFIEAARFHSFKAITGEEAAINTILSDDLAGEG